MAYVLTDNIISPLGLTSDECFAQVCAGKSGLRVYPAGGNVIPEAFCASLLDDDCVDRLHDEVGDTARSLSRFETIALASAQRAVAGCGVDFAQTRAVLILSTTKGAVEAAYGEERQLAAIAAMIADRLGIKSKPYVVCNACVSGVSALTLASRLLQRRAYDYAVVVGADCPHRFVVSGFQSLKALSTEPCRPFDMERFGLNLGEAAATVVLSANPAGDKPQWSLTNGYSRNDAFHVSAPSKTAEGLYSSLTATLQGIDHEQLALISAHGTATLFNDQMESVAVTRAGLTDVPVSALKGYFGHTLGAAGVVETIITMRAVDNGTVPATRGFEELGVSGKVNISASQRPTQKTAFVKMLSGFGGCNATILAEKTLKQPSEPVSTDYDVTHTVSITPDGAIVDGKPLAVDTAGDPLLTAIYKQHIGGYAKFYKMDSLCRLGFIASELLLQAEARGDEAKEGRAVVLFNRTSSADSDRKYRESIADDDYFPSPSVFVYTLPNIVTGEIAMRNGYHGETTFYIIPDRDDLQIDEALRATLLDASISSVITGWIDCSSADSYEAYMQIIERKI